MDVTEGRWWSFRCVGEYITTPLCATADEMAREGRKWAHSLSHSLHFWKLQFVPFCPCQLLLCCQAAECFAESWAAWHGYVGHGGQIDQSFQLRPKAATIIKFGLDHVVVIYKALNREMEESTQAGKLIPPLLPFSLDLFILPILSLHFLYLSFLPHCCLLYHLFCSKISLCRLPWKQ